MQWISVLAQAGGQLHVPVLQVGETGIQFEQTVLAEKPLHLDPTEVGTRAGNFRQGEWHGKSKEDKIRKKARQRSRAQHKGAIHSRQDPATVPKLL